MDIITKALWLEDQCRYTGIKVSRQLGFAMLLNRYSYPRCHGDMAAVQMLVTTHKGHYTAVGSIFILWGIKLLLIPMESQVA